MKASDNKDIMKKELLNETSPKYLKRLVRELNQEGMVNGFYASAGSFNERCNRARFSKGVLEVKPVGGSNVWYKPAVYIFTDSNGQEICASRQS